MAYVFERLIFRSVGHGISFPRFVCDRQTLLYTCTVNNNHFLRRHKNRSNQPPITIPGFGPHADTNS